MNPSFEAVMSNEFRTLEGACSTLVPQGTGYENVAIENQACTSVGSLPGQAFCQWTQVHQAIIWF